MSLNTLNPRRKRLKGTPPLDPVAKPTTRHRIVFLITVLAVYSIYPVSGDAVSRSTRSPTVVTRAENQSDNLTPGECKNALGTPGIASVSGVSIIRFQVGYLRGILQQKCLPERHLDTRDLTGKLDFGNVGLGIVTLRTTWHNIPSDVPPLRVEPVDAVENILSEHSATFPIPCSGGMSPTIATVSLEQCENLIVLKPPAQLFQTSHSFVLCENGISNRHSIWSPRHLRPVAPTTCSEALLQISTLDGNPLPAVTLTEAPRWDSPPTASNFLQDFQPAKTTAREGREPLNRGDAPFNSPTIQSCTWDTQLFRDLFHREPASDKTLHLFLRGSLAHMTLLRGYTPKPFSKQQRIRYVVEFDWLT